MFKRLMETKLKPTLEQFTKTRVSWLGKGLEGVEGVRQTDGTGI